jgi:hypothetical protein
VILRSTVTILPISWRYPGSSNPHNGITVSAQSGNMFCNTANYFNCLLCWTKLHLLALFVSIFLKQWYQNVCNEILNNVGHYIFYLLTFYIQHVSPGQEMHETYASVKNDTSPTEILCFDNNTYISFALKHTHAHIASNHSNCVHSITYMIHVHTHNTKTNFRYIAVWQKHCLSVLQANIWHNYQVWHFCPLFDLSRKVGKLYFYPPKLILIY